MALAIGSGKKYKRFMRSTTNLSYLSTYDLTLMFIGAACHPDPLNKISYVTANEDRGTTMQRYIHSQKMIRPKYFPILHTAIVLKNITIS